MQMQIHDYFGTPTMDIFIMSDPKGYRIARKRFRMWFYTNPKSFKKQNPLKMKYHQITEYSVLKIAPLLPKFPYFHRFYDIPQTIYQNYAENIISEKEWGMLHSLQEFTGYFNHLFEFNDLTFFDDLQEELEANDVNFKGLFLYDIIVLELFRRQLGFHDFSGPQKMIQFLVDNPLKGIFHNPNYFPTAADVSYVLKKLPAKKIFEFFQGLVQDAIELRIIDPRILLWDGQFIRSNCNNNFKDKNAKKLKQYNDPDAGYGRHLGVKKGVGYEASNLFAYSGSWNRTLPVYFEMVSANSNENPVFRQTLRDFRQTTNGKIWKMVILDSGGYSDESLKFCVQNDLYPLIRAKKNLKTQPTRELKKGYYFNTNFIPSNWTDEDVLSAYAIRPAIEAAQSANNTFYNSQRLNTRGKEMATTNRCLNYILDIMKAITAFKLGRCDLIGKESAFSSTREHLMNSAWVNLASKSGFSVLQSVPLTPLQKAFWDRRLKFKQGLEEKRKNLKK